MLQYHPADTVHVHAVQGMVERHMDVFPSKMVPARPSHHIQPESMLSFFVIPKPIYFKKTWLLASSVTNTNNLKLEHLNSIQLASNCLFLSYFLFILRRMPHNTSLGGPDIPEEEEQQDIEEQQAKVVAKEPLTKDAEIQTIYRESEAQTDPYSPEYHLEDPNSEPEILRLQQLGLKWGLHTLPI